MLSNLILIIIAKRIMRQKKLINKIFSRSVKSTNIQICIERKTEKKKERKKERKKEDRKCLLFHKWSDA